MYARAVPRNRQAAAVVAAGDVMVTQAGSDGANAVNNACKSNKMLPDIIMHPAKG